MHTSPAQKKFDNKIIELIEFLKPYGLLERIDFFSRYFLGKPYLAGALGEGFAGEFDQSPLYRDDAFDCLTYVNTVMALAKAHDITHFKSLIKQINYYEGQVRYENRFHFMCQDWNRMNAQQNFVQDITQEWLDNNNQPVMVWSEALINKRNWFLKRQLADIKLLKPSNNLELQARLKKLHALAEQQPVIRSRISYVPLNQVLQDLTQNLTLLRRLPSVMIVEIVRPNWDLTEQIGTHLNVSHLGFAIWREAKQDYVFRHASLLTQKVSEISLSEYLRPYLNSPTIKGINLQKIVINYV